MATPLTHIILTDKIYDKTFPACDKKDFLLGTLLPDIRYLDPSIPRERMHFPHITLPVIQQLLSCFDKGLYFHSLVDQTRDAFYVAKGIYIPGGDEDFIIALKLLEDQYLFHKVHDRPKYIALLHDIPYETLAAIPKDSLEQWYAMIRNSIQDTGPSDDTRRAFQSRLGLSEEYTNKINAIIHTIEHDEKILALIDEFYESFDELITQNF